ncbi:MAG: YfhO family protein, partial [Clostridia bacterium]|nr:YfhO family protein [Clostridia bacterium]
MQAKQRQSFYRESFLFALIIALSFLLPYMIIDKGLFLFYGDYDVQQVPFYMLMHDSIRSGNIFWSWYTDLGSNFLGSYAFYNVGSPFFWLTLPLPDKLVPYCLGPLLCLKIATASLTSSAYISRFVKNKELAVLGGLLYAFSSFSVYNIFFNHFHEALAFFPLMLIALEELVVNDRKGMFALTVLLSALTNYFFFIEEVVFLVIYWIIRLFSGEWEVSFKKFLNVAFESVLGVGLSAVLFLPAMLQVMGNTRINTLLSGWNLLVYGWAQRLPDIIHSVFFPQDLPAFPNFFPDSGANWSSVAAWLPLFSMTGVIAFMAAKKGHWLKRIIVASFVIALIPGLNAMFVLMVDSYYGRWFFMPVLMMCTATIMALDDPEIDLMHGLKWTVLFT